MILNFSKSPKGFGFLKKSNWRTNCQIGGQRGQNGKLEDVLLIGGRLCSMVMFQGFKTTFLALSEGNFQKQFVCFLKIAKLCLSCTSYLTYKLNFISISFYAFYSMHFILCIKFHEIILWISFCGFHSMYYIICISFFAFHSLHFILFI
jgi:hypothetical protein